MFARVASVYPSGAAIVFPQQNPESTAASPSTVAVCFSHPLPRSAEIGYARGGKTNGPLRAREVSLIFGKCQVGRTRRDVLV